MMIGASMGNPTTQLLFEFNFSSFVSVVLLRLR